MPIMKEDAEKLSTYAGRMGLRIPRPKEDMKIAIYRAMKVLLKGVMEKTVQSPKSKEMNLR